MKNHNINCFQTKHSFQAVSFATVVNNFPSDTLGQQGPKSLLGLYSNFHVMGPYTHAADSAWTERKGRGLLMEWRPSSYSVLQTIFNYASLGCCFSNIATKYVVLPTWWLSQCGEFLLLLLVLITWLTDTHSDWKVGIIWSNNHTSESVCLAELCLLIWMAKLPQSWGV